MTAKSFIPTNYQKKKEKQKQNIFLANQALSFVEDRAVSWINELDEQFTNNMLQCKTQNYDHLHLHYTIQWWYILHITLHYIALYYITLHYSTV